MKDLSIGDMVEVDSFGHCTKTLTTDYLQVYIDHTKRALVWSMYITCCSSSVNLT